MPSSSQARRERAVRMGSGRLGGIGEFVPVRPLIRCLCWLTRTWPGLPGRWRLVEWLGHHQSLVATCGTATIRVGGGYRMHVNPADFTERPIWINGFDPRDQQTLFFRQSLRPGDCVLDIGANVGYYSLLAASLVGPGGSVHAFEPCETALTSLRRNVALNPAAAVTLHPLALADRVQSAPFFVASEAHTGLSSLRDLGDRTHRVAEVATAPLDHLIDTIPPVRLMKIDVEGAELRVLRGARGLLERDRPDLLLELTDAFLQELGGSAEQVCEWLAGFGYSLYRIGAHAHLQPIHQAPLEQCHVLAPGRSTRIELGRFLEP